jgi:Protein of unknown function (DUF3592)
VQWFSEKCFFVRLAGVNVEAMNPISNVVILLVAIFFTGCFFKIAVPASAPQWIHQFASRNYPSTTGQITRSEVTHKANSKGTIFYDVDIRYRYEVGGQTFDAARFRYTPLIRCADPAWTQNIVNVHPVSSQTQVFYNPQNPADALLSPRINGDDLVDIMDHWGLFVIMPLLWAIPADWLYRVIFKPIAGGVKILEEGQFVRARLRRFRPILVTLMTAVFVPGLVCTYVFGGTHPSVKAVEMAMAVTFGILVALYFLCLIKICSGDYDLIINEGSRTVGLPKTLFGRERVTVGLSEISAVTVEVLTKRGAHGAAYLTYAPTLRVHGKESKAFKLADWFERNRAEDFAAWLRKQLGVLD